MPHLCDTLCILLKYIVRPVALSTSHLIICHHPNSTHPSHLFIWPFERLTAIITHHLPPLIAASNSLISGVAKNSTPLCIQGLKSPNNRFGLRIDSTSNSLVVYEEVWIGICHLSGRGHCLVSLSLSLSLFDEVWRTWSDQ